MKKYILSVLFVSLCIAFTIHDTAEAQSRPGNTELGIILGEPTGISAKFWNSNRSAFDAGVAWTLSGDGALHLHADYLLHNWLSVESGSLAFYYGIGGRLLLANDPRVGVRVPVGLQYIIPDSRLGLFFEVVPTLNLIPSTSFGVNGGIGVRFFL